MAIKWAERVGSKLQIDEDLLHVFDVQPLQNPICKCQVTLSIWYKLSVAAGGMLTTATWALKGLLCSWCNLGPLVSEIQFPFGGSLNYGRDSIAKTKQWWGDKPL